MKKLFVSLVCVFTALTSAGQTFSPIAKVVDMKDHAIVVAQNGQSLGINPFLHERLVKKPADYLMLDIAAEFGEVRTLIRKDMISEWVVEVDTVAYLPSYDMVAVKFTDGTTFVTPQLIWLKVRKGQHAVRKILYGETKVAGYVATVERSEPLHEGNRPQRWEARAKDGRLLGALLLPGESTASLFTGNDVAKTPTTNDLAQVPPTQKVTLLAESIQQVTPPAQPAEVTQPTQIAQPAEVTQPTQPVTSAVRQVAVPVNTQTTKHVAIRK